MADREVGRTANPVSRAEPVCPEKVYRLLGAHWYAKGLYIKGTKTGAEIRARTLYRVEGGDFVYNRLFAWMGSFAVADETTRSCYVSNEFPCFLVNPVCLDGRYLWLYLSRPAAWAEALGLSSGGTPTSRNRLKEEKLLGMWMVLPPLEEQRRIVARVEALAGRIEEAKELREQAITDSDALKVQAIAACFPRSANDEARSFMTIQGGYAFKSEWFTDEGVRLVRNVNVGHGQLEWDQTARIPEEMRRSFGRFELAEGDILILTRSASEGVGPWTEGMPRDLRLACASG